MVTEISHHVLFDAMQIINMYKGIYKDTCLRVV
jgi:hypothetical protein